MILELDRRVCSVPVHRAAAGEEGSERERGTQTLIKLNNFSLSFFVQCVVSMALGARACSPPTLTNDLVINIFLFVRR